jgi:hypothetical protein
MKSMIAAALFAAALTCGQSPDAGFKDLQFLTGRWKAIGGGQPGAGSGEFSFDAELGGKILVRHNYAEYAAGTAAIARHDDLMVVYLEGSPRAIYFDSEGHVIRYSVKVPAPDTVVFESDGSQPGPRYRLSYKLDGKTLNGKFEMAQPGSNDFKPYLAWASTKK